MLLVPVLTKILDPGRSSVYAITTLIALFPAFVLVTSALKGLPRAAEYVASAFGASRLRRLRYIHAPATIPSIVTALRLSAGTSVLVAIVAEFLTGAGGIGKVFLLSKLDLLTARSWGVAIAGAVVSVLLFRGAQRLEERVVGDRQ